MSLYDAHPYHSRAFAFTHPDQLHVIARLFGAEPAPVETARILELGSAAGGNLWPMAAQLPDAEVVGVDLSEVQIEQGLEMVEALDLDNLSFRWADIMELTDELGTFDYVIAHGFYSWVPPEVAEGLLALIGRCLRPNGVGIVTYNTLPGWGVKRMTREMMRLHTQGMDDPAEAIGQARGLVEWLTTVVDPGSPWGVALAAEHEALLGTGDHVMLHGRLSEHNHPVWFRDFNLALGRNGLQYLADAELATMMPDSYGPDVGEALEGVADDIVVLEQYLDFISGRSFRRSLIVPAGDEPDRAISADRLDGLHVSGRLWPTEDVGDLRDESPLPFQASSGATMEVAEPLLKAALVVLAERSPATLPLDELVALACERIGRKPKPARKELVATNLIPLFMHRIVELYPRALPIAAAVPDKPEATLLARLQAEMGVEVTTGRHDSQVLKPFDRALLQELNGSRTAAELAEWLEPEGGVDTVTERLEALRRMGLVLP